MENFNNIETSFRILISVGKTIAKMGSQRTSDMMVQDKKSEIMYYDRENLTPEEAEVLINKGFKHVEGLMKSLDISAFLYYLSKYVDLNKSSRCLDAGSGPAHISYIFEKKTSFKMVAMDLSMLALKVANRIKSTDGFKTELLRGDLEKPCFRDNSFDIVLIYQTLHHFPDLNTPLRAVYRILKPGGKLIVEDANLLYWPVFWKATKLKVKGKPWGSENEWPYTKFRLQKSLKDIGFKIIILRNIRYLPLSVVGNRLHIDDYISQIPLANLFGSRIFCVAQK
jgi:SAM-dependent methyltransferase